jgi:hypothetical protein
LIGPGDHSENTNSGIAKRKVLKPGPAGYTETGNSDRPRGFEATLNDIAWPGTVADRPCTVRGIPFHDDVSTKTSAMAGLKKRKPPTWKAGARSADE